MGSLIRSTIERWGGWQDQALNAVAGIVAGFLVVGGAVALFRFGKRKAGDLRRAIDEFSGGPRNADGAILDYERDPETGVFRPRP